MAIRSFKQKWLEAFYYEDIVDSILPNLRDRLFRKLKLIEYASSVNDLRSPPGNMLHPLVGKRKGQWAIAVSGPWRLCFYFDDGEASEVELVQYH
ncbi:MAG: type II toxin-antitoxin system RelE/ParE family toxin [Legionellales bacterium]